MAAQATRLSSLYSDAAQAWTYQIPSSLEARDQFERDVNELTDHLRNRANDAPLTIDLVREARVPVEELEGGDELMKATWRRARDWIATPVVEQWRRWVRIPELQRDGFPVEQQEALERVESYVKETLIPYLANIFARFYLGRIVQWNIRQWTVREISLVLSNDQQMCAQELGRIFNVRDQQVAIFHRDVLDIMNNHMDRIVECIAQDAPVRFQHRDRLGQDREITLPPPSYR